MEGNNNAPFGVGQKIVRIGETTSGPVAVIKGKVYTSAGCVRCPKCGHWKVLLEEFPVTGPNQKATCLCGNREHYPFYCASPKKFAPINPAYENISSELAQEAMKQRTETDVPVKEVVVN